MQVVWQFKGEPSVPNNCSRSREKQRTQPTQALIENDMPVTHLPNVCGKDIISALLRLYSFCKQQGPSIGGIHGVILSYKKKQIQKTFN